MVLLSEQNQLKFLWYCSSIAESGFTDSTTLTVGKLQYQFRLTGGGESLQSNRARLKDILCLFLHEDNSSLTISQFWVPSMTIPSRSGSLSRLVCLTWESCRHSHNYNDKNRNIREKKKMYCHKVYVPMQTASTAYLRLIRVERKTRVFYSRTF